MGFRVWVLGFRVWGLGACTKFLFSVGGACILVVYCDTVDIEVQLEAIRVDFRA